MCSETSPRISFSNDLPQNIDNPQMQIPRRSDTSLLDSNSDFEFIISHNTQFEQKSSSADELFAYGMILPVQGRKKADDSATSQIKKKCNAPHPNSTKNEKITEIGNYRKTENSTIFDGVEKAASNNKSFWKFKRSSSLKCDVVNNKKSIISSFPILSRSHSTGSAAQKPKKLPIAVRSSSLSNSSSTTTMQNLKPPLLKKNGGGYGNGMKINPVLNMHPPPYISRFGFGFLLRNGSKDKKNKN